MKRAVVSVLLVLAAIPTLAGDGHDQVGGPVIYIDVLYNKGPDGASQGRVSEYANADIAACLRTTMTEKHLPVQFATDQHSARYLLHVESGDYEDCAKLEQQGFALVCAGFNRSTRITGAQLLDTSTQQVVWSSDERKKWNGISLFWPSQAWECRTADFAKRLAGFIKKR
jgi:hypothetical protein